MVYPSRLKNIKTPDLEVIEDILRQRDFFEDFSYYIKRKTGKFPEELE